MMATEIIDPLTLDATTLDLYTDLVNQYRHELDPDQPLYDAAEVRRQISTVVDFFREERYIVWNADRTQIVGRCYVGCLTGFDTNRALADGFVYVAPQYRRQGVGRRLLQPMVDAMWRWERTILTSFTDSRMVEGEQALAVVSPRKGMAQVISELVLADVDRALLADWVARAQERAAGYTLRFFDGAYPPTLYDAMAEMLNLMNSAPREDMPWEDVVWTADHMRQMDEELVTSGRERWVAVSVAPDGRFCGYSAVYWWAGEPLLVQQGDTAIDPVHRNLGLGRWLKAAMVQRLLLERPQVKRVRTGNAGSNAPMLAINRALGFRPAYTVTGWQVARDDLAAYLARAA